MNFINSLREKSANAPTKKILLPEGEDIRILKAALILKDEGLADPVILGDKNKISQITNDNKLDFSGIEIIDPAVSINSEYIDLYLELRKHIGMTLKLAASTMLDPLFYAAMMVRMGGADGALAGAMNTTGNVLRAGIQIIGLAKNITAVSSCFFMVLQNQCVLTFGDCAVIPEPTVDQLVSIALSTSQTHEIVLQEKPNVAMLSFSTMGSAKHEAVSKVIEATQKLKQLKPNLNIDGELQFDAAYNMQTAKRKAPESSVAGQANVYIFPDLDSGNIGYKIAQRLGGAEAIGPIIQGLAKPYNDLSRGCSVHDIVNTACILSLM